MQTHPIPHDLFPYASAEIQLILSPHMAPPLQSLPWVLQMEQNTSYLVILYYLFF